MSMRSCNGLPHEEPAADTQELSNVLFHVIGDADAGLVPRVLDPVAKLNLVPRRLHASCEDGDGSVLSVDLRLGVVSRVAGQRVEAAIRRLVGVHQVVAVYEQV